MVKSSTEYMTIRLEDTNDIPAFIMVVNMSDLKTVLKDSHSIKDIFLNKREVI